MNEKTLCKTWGENACLVQDVLLERLRDFYRVSGMVTNVLKCTLPHLQLKLAILDRRGEQVTEDVFHITDRRLEPGEIAAFKIEGEWKKGMVEARVTVWPCLGWS